MANADAVKQLRTLSQSVLPPGKSAKHLAAEKPLVVLLNELLGQHHHHLIFLGVKGTNLLKKILIGSEAVKIIDGINNVVVALPREPKCFSSSFMRQRIFRKLRSIQWNKDFLIHTGSLLSSTVNVSSRRADLFLARVHWPLCERASIHFLFLIG